MGLPLRGFRLFLFFLVAAGLCASPVLAREAGWVPPPGEAYKLPGKPAPGKSRESRAVKKHSEQKNVSPRARRETVYDGQPAVTESELYFFMDILPQFRAWARKNGEEAHPVLGKNGRPDFLYSPKAARWVSEHKFDPARFFCIMGRMAAALAIVEDGNDRARPADMPPVDPGELSLARKHLGELLAAGNSAEPIR